MTCSHSHEVAQELEFVSRGISAEDVDNSVAEGKATEGAEAMQVGGIVVYKKGAEPAQEIGPNVRLRLRSKFTVFRCTCVRRRKPSALVQFNVRRRRNERCRVSCRPRSMSASWHSNQS